MSPPIDTQITAFLQRYQAEGAFWTGDIALSIRQPTATVRRALERLAAQGQVEKCVIGGRGHPTSWQLVAGPKA